jgi:hypothetical protein
VPVIETIDYIDFSVSNSSIDQILVGGFNWNLVFDYLCWFFSFSNYDSISRFMIGIQYHKKNYQEEKKKQTRLGLQLWLVDFLR